MNALLLAGLIGLVPAPPSAIAGELARLRGHEVKVAKAGDSYAIRSVAGEGAPLVGVVERRGRELWLDTGDAALRLEGALAVPRIAGPGYRVWVLGDVRGEVLLARRLGVLAPPGRDGTPDTRESRSR